MDDFLSNPLTYVAFGFLIAKFIYIDAKNDGIRKAGTTPEELEKKRRQEVLNNQISLENLNTRPPEPPKKSITFQIIEFGFGLSLCYFVVVLINACN